MPRVCVYQPVIFSVLDCVLRDSATCSPDRLCKNSAIENGCYTVGGLLERVRDLYRRSLVFSEDPALVPLSEMMPVLACEEMYGESTANGQDLYS